MIVRELFAILGMQTDQASFKNASSAIDGVKKAAEVLGGLFFTGLVARGLDKFTRMAADVQDTSALLDTVFGDNANAVKQWAADTASYVGRSEYALRDFASQLGAVIAPMVGVNAASTKMSTDLAQLAIDLASVFNTADKDALIALRSGLLGESEPMRRFGVNLLDSQLAVFATTLGKTFKGMNEAEKMQLRYQYILKQTALFQGNANRELAEFTNASKYLSSRINDLGIKIGEALLPGMNRLVHLATSAVDWFLRMARGTKIIEASLYALQGVMAVLAVTMLLPFMPAILSALLLAAAIAAVVIAAEDVYGFFTGKFSLTGVILEKLGVDGNRVRLAFMAIGEVASRIWDASTEAIGRLAGKVMGLGGDQLPSIGAAVEWLGRKFNHFLDWVEPKLMHLLEIDWNAKLKDWGMFFDGLLVKIGTFLSSPLGRTLTAVLGAWAGRKLGETVGSSIAETMFDPSGYLPQPLAGLYDRVTPDWSKNLSHWAGRKVGSVLGGFGGMIGGASIGAGLAMPVNAGPSVNFSSTSNITVGGPASQSDKDAVRQVVQEENERAARELQASLLPLYGTQ